MAVACMDNMCDDQFEKTQQNVFGVPGFGLEVKEITFVFFIF